MKNILLLGTGRSSSALIRYLLSNAEAHSWELTIADAFADPEKNQWNDHPHLSIQQADINDEGTRAELIKKADIVISLLPPQLHLMAIKTCLEFSRPVLTASYVSPEIEALNGEALKKNILILMECGLDPGLDHMSAMKEINSIREEGAKLIAFRSYAGGLIAPESDNNPWHYKFTWNPRNVVLAGQGTVKYLDDHQYKYIPYNRLFSRLEKIQVEDYGDFEAYANRDSLKYIKTYGLEGIGSFLRGTLRRPGFCAAWNVFVQLGMTDDTWELENPGELTWRKFIASFLDENKNLSVEENLCVYLNLSPDGEVMRMLRWLGIFEDKKNDLPRATPAQALQKLLEEKWKLDENDKDMIVMQHQFEFEKEGKKKKLISSLVVTGEDSTYTAMAKTVGLPLGIAAKLILQGKLKLSGVRIPVEKEIYVPVLEELESLGVKFKLIDNG